jgi:hypothetical protein
MIQMQNLFSTRKLPSAFVPTVLPLTLALILALASVVGMSVADACRDCPFPMKIGDGRWLMPNRKLEMTIEEIRPDQPWHEMRLRLFDPISREVVASGSSYIRKGATDILFSLRDKQGFPVHGDVHFLDTGHQHLQVRFTCNACSIGDLFE